MGYSNEAEGFQVDSPGTFTTFHRRFCNRRPGRVALGVIPVPLHRMVFARRQKSQAMVPCLNRCWWWPIWRQITRFILWPIIRVINHIYRSCLLLKIIRHAFVCCSRNQKRC